MPLSLTSCHFLLYPLVNTCKSKNLLWTGRLRLSESALSQLEGDIFATAQSMLTPMPSHPEDLLSNPAFCVFVSPNYPIMVTFALSLIFMLCLALYPGLCHTALWPYLYVCESSMTRITVLTKIIKFYIRGGVGHVGLLLEGTCR